jgi:hypothetical protein
MAQNSVQLVARLEALDAEVRQWGNDLAKRLSLAVQTRQQENQRANAALLYRYARLPLRGRIALKDSIKTRIRYYPGGLEIRAINVSFLKHGIFFDVGVGKGRPRGSSQAKPNPWLYLIDYSLDELADILQTGYADVAVGEIRFLVPGVIDRRINITANG